MKGGWELVADWNWRIERRWPLGLAQYSAAIAGVEAALEAEAPQGAAVHCFEH